MPRKKQQAGTHPVRPDSVPVELRDAHALATHLLDGVNAPLQQRLRLLLQEHAAPGQSLRRVCDDFADPIARIAGAPDRTAPAVLKPEGWLMLDYRDVLPHHVYAVAILMAIEECSPGNISLAITLDCQQMISNAVFMAGRTDMKRRVEANEAARRSANAQKGGAPQKFTDAQLRESRDRWIAEHGKARGWAKAASYEFAVTDKAIISRWKKIQTQPG